MQLVLRNAQRRALPCSHKCILTYLLEHLIKRIVKRDSQTRTMLNGAAKSNFFLPVANALMNERDKSWSSLERFHFGALCNCFGSVGTVLYGGQSSSHICTTSFARAAVVAFLHIILQMGHELMTTKLVRRVTAVKP